MPVVTFSKKYLLKLLSVKLDDKKLASQITKFGFEVERIQDDEISIEVTPNRPDLLGAVGFARSLKNFMHRSKKLTYEISGDEPAFALTVGKEVGPIRPYIACFAAYGLKLDDESLTDVINFTEKLSTTYGRGRKKIAIGLHDLTEIEPPLYYNAYKDEKFVPLNEKKEKLFSEAIKTNAKGMKYGGILENSKGRYPALKDNIGVLSLIPITNSERGKVSVNTKDMLVVVDGTYHESINKTADLLAATFLDLGAEIKRIAINYPGKNTEMTPQMTSKYISIPLALAEGEIGVKIGFNNIISLANKMGYRASLIEREIKFRVPEYRLDVLNEQDVVEDVAIAYGYDYIQPVPIRSSQHGELEPKEKAFEALSEAMVGMGFSEMMNTYLVNEESNFKKMGIKDGSSYLKSRGLDYVRLKAAKAASLTMMRTWLLPSLLRNLSMSRHERMPHKLFELDLVFYLEKGKPREDYHIAGVIADPKSNFNYVKGVIESLAYLLKLDIKIEKYEHQSFIKGRCAKIILEKGFLGLFGELHPQALSDFGVEEPATAFEMDLTSIVKQATSQ